jgi:hypothetical protein
VTDATKSPGQKSSPSEIVPKVVRAAIGIAALLWPRCTRHTGVIVAVRDVAALLDGHVTSWSRWESLSNEERLRVARLIRHRPSDLANEERLKTTLRMLLLQDALPGCQAAPDPTDGDVLVSPGMPLQRFVDVTLDELDEIRRLARRCLSPAPQDEYTTVIRHAGADGVETLGVDARISVRWPAPAVELPRVVDAGPQRDLVVPVDELIAIARRLDGPVDDGEEGYRTASVRRLFARLCCSVGSVSDRWQLTAGATRVLNAPTGVGKSVLMEVLACWAATNEQVVTLVVATNAEVLQLTARLEHALGKLGSDAQVTPLMSPSALVRSAEAVVRQRPAWDRYGEWCYAQLGYGCALAAATQADEHVDVWQPGQEPCTRLHRSTTAGRRSRALACPWRPTCGKFRLARAACSADVIITTHANFVLGRLQAPVQDDDGVTDGLTVEELVLRRSSLVVIDEVDTFQATALQSSARGLRLVEGRRLRTPLRRLDEEFGSALGRLRPEIDADARDAISTTRYLSEAYVSHIVHGRLAPTRPTRGGPGPSRSWLVPRRWDSWLASRLLGSEADQPVPEEHILALRSLFLGEGDASHVPEPLRPVSALLRAVATPGSGAGEMESCHIDLDHLLVSRVPDPGQRSQVVDRLLRRAHLERLRQMLIRLVHSAPHLAAAGIDAADSVVEAFGLQARWQVTPNGPLGRLLFAFTEHVEEDRIEDTRLTAAAFGGDPHTYTMDLGDTLALSRAGTRRVVLGLSATAYFPGAPHHHVHLRPTWWVADDTPDAVKVLSAPVSTEDRALLRVSGRTGREREDALRLMGRLLWTRRLDDELALLRRETPERARVLLATTSYDGARLLAEGLAEAGAAGRICLLVRSQPAPLAPADGHREVGRWVELPADRVEEFPRLPADVLVAPLARVQRGVNLIGAGDRSALGAIWLAVRPVPVLDEPDELIAHVNAHAIAEHPVGDDLASLLAARGRTAGRYFEDIVRSQPYFRSLPEDVRLSVAAEILVGLIQLVGRARRGGTSATIHLADAAFLDGTVGSDLATMIDSLHQRWEREGVLGLMDDLYGSALTAFLDYARARKEAQAC